MKKPFPDLPIYSFLNSIISNAYKIFSNRLNIYIYIYKFFYNSIYTKCSVTLFFLIEHPKDQYFIFKKVLNNYIHL